MVTHELEAAALGQRIGVRSHGKLFNWRRRERSLLDRRVKRSQRSSAWKLEYRVLSKKLWTDDGVWSFAAEPRECSANFGSVQVTPLYPAGRT